MSFPRLRVAATAVALVLAAGPAFSQTPMPDPLDARDAKRVERMEKVVRELRSIVFQLRDTGHPVVVQPADTDARIQELSNRVADLEQVLTRLNGALDTLNHDVAQTQRVNQELQAQVKDLNDRLAAAEQATQGGAPAPGDTGPAPAPKASAGEAFTQARELMLAGDYDAAQGAFAAYVEAYPDSPRTPEANYWWGKTLSVKGAHAQAVQAYIGAIRGWPKTSWAPDAVGELARSLVALKKPQDACAALAELGKRYPKAPAAVTARAATTAKQAKCAA
jgi:tol-pal system protein YbgF